MEAVPRVPMISFELKISPKGTDFGPRLKQCIMEQYEEDPEMYTNEINQLEGLRAAAVHPAKDFTGCAVMKRYYCQLHFLCSRFPMEREDSHSITYYWKDIYGVDVCNYVSIKSEMASVLYNIGALHSQLGAEDSRVSPDGMKMACTHYQCAAWCFQHLSTKLTSHECADLSIELMSFMNQVCLAQAQECILEKSMMDNRKATIIAKVAIQTSDYYKHALNILCDKNHDCSFSDAVGSKTSKKWEKYLKFKLTYYGSIALLYQGQQSEEQQKMGERVAYYQAAFDKLEEARKLSKGLDNIEAVKEALTFSNDVIEAKKKTAKNENEFIYHEEVPNIALLSDIKGASLVKGIPFCESDSEVSGPDIFERLVPMTAHVSSSLYSEEKAKLLRKITSMIDHKDQELESLLSALQLNQLDVNPDSNLLPQELVDRCAALSAKPNAVQSLIENMNQLSDVFINVEEMLNEIQELLCEEEKNEKEYQEMMGKRPPSIAATDLTREAKKYQEAHSKASESNQTLHKAMTLHVANLRILTLPLDELEAKIPVVEIQSQEDTGLLKELQHLMNKVDEMKNQRIMLLNQLRESVRNDNITERVILHGNENLDNLFEDELNKHQKYVNLLEQNLSAQENIMRAIKDSYSKYAPARKNIKELTHQRFTYISSLVTAYDAYEDLLEKSNKGLDFYHKLETSVSKLLQRVKATCKVQDEEREQILAKNKPQVIDVKKANATSLPHGGGKLKLKDYLDMKKETGTLSLDSLPTTSLQSGGYYNTSSPPPPQQTTWIPGIRPAPVGSEGTEPSLCYNTQSSRTDDDEKTQSYLNLMRQSTYQKYVADSNYSQINSLGAYKASEPSYSFNYQQPSLNMNTGPEMFQNQSNLPYLQTQNTVEINQSVNSSQQATVPNMSTNLYYLQQGYQISAVPPTNSLFVTGTSVDGHNKSISGTMNMPSMHSQSPSVSGVMNVPSLHSHSSSYVNNVSGQSYMSESGSKPSIYSQTGSGYSTDSVTGSINQSGSTTTPLFSQTGYAGTNIDGVGQTKCLNTGDMSQSNYSNTAGMNQPNYLNTAGMNQPNYSNTGGVKQSNYSISTEVIQPNNYLNTAGMSQPNYSNSTGMSQPNYSNAAGMSQPNYSNAAGLSQPNYSNAAGMSQPNYSNAAGLSQPNYSNAGGMSQPNYSNAAGLSQPNYSNAAGMSQPNYPNAVGMSQPNYSNVAGLSQPNYSNAAGMSQPNYSSTVVGNQLNYSNTNEINETNYSNPGGVSQSSYSNPAGVNQQIYTNPDEIKKHSFYDSTSSTSVSQHSYINPSVSSQQGYLNSATGYDSTSSLNHQGYMNPVSQHSYLNTLGNTGVVSSQTLDNQPNSVVSTSQAYYTSYLPSNLQLQDYSNSFSTNTLTNQPNTSMEMTYNVSSHVSGNSSNVNLSEPNYFSQRYGNQQSVVYPAASSNQGLYMQAAAGGTNITTTAAITYSSQSLTQSITSPKSSNLDLLSGLEYNIEQTPLEPKLVKDEKGKDDNRKEERGLVVAAAATAAAAVGSEEKSSVLCTSTSDPYADPQSLNHFVQDVEKFEKLVEGLTMKTLNGPTTLDIKWNEIVNLQEKDSHLHNISVARCYPMKNRYPDILPYDDSRVELPSTKDEYINASYMKGLTKSTPPFILTQAPMQSTCSDFWTMVYEQQVEIIVCLVSNEELEEQTYWPVDKSKIMQVGKLNVSLQSVNVKNNNYTERILSLCAAETRMTRIVVHLQYTSWPGSSFPSSPGPFLQFVSDCINYFSQQRCNNHSIVVHCLSGVGRTGLFCLLVAALSEIQGGNGLIDLVSVAAKMSESRRGCIRDREHLKFAYMSVLYFAQDLLMKRGILTNCPSFEEKRSKDGKCHTRHPSEDFLLGPPTDVNKLQSGLEKLGFDSNELKNEVVPRSSSVCSRRSSMTSSGRNSPVPQTNSTNILSSLDPARLNLNLEVKQTNKNKKHFTKEHFMKKSHSSLDNFEVDQSTQDPLSKLDPLWSLKK